MCTYKVTIQEVGRNQPIVTTISNKKMTNQQIVDFFGLNQPDIVSYKIEEI